MDVTSLLNANAAEQQKKGDGSKTTPTRNRTPWDAGGYSLPINTLSSIPMTTTASSSSSTTRTSTPPQGKLPSQEQEPSVDTPSSPRHKFSDSRSSLSSFTSSLQSASHSRFSSLSTVGSLHQVNSISEAISGPKKACSDFGNPSINTTDISRPATSSTQSRGSVSPTASMEALILAAEKHSVSQRPASTLKTSNEDSNMSQTTEKPSSPSQNEFVAGPRPSSPSDAILIKRSMVPSLRVNTGEQDLRIADDADLKNNYLSAPLEHHMNLLLNSRGHKRALSAPDFSGVNHNFIMSEHSNSPNMGPRPDPTPPRSTHPDNESPISPVASSYPAPDTPPANTTEPSAKKELKCMFVDPCDTGSQLRKAISHIFGRNKMCTRLIPDEIWVHYCRKHYQRSRYRDPKRYANVQSSLVLQQICQIHEWSEENRHNGRAGVVESWGLAVRKREQKRLDEMGPNRKRKSSTVDDEDDPAAGGSTPHPHTAVPDWLLELTGKGYATEQILNIAHKLNNEILNNQHMSFPDIEILPNIIVNQDEPKSPKGYTKRNSGATAGLGHKRAQSLGVGMKSEYYAPGRRSSHPAVWSQDGSSHGGSIYGSPIQKRRRGNDLSETTSPIVPPFRNHLGERPLEASRRLTSFSQQPMYDIDEHQASNDRYSAQAPLPAPTPQRIGGQTMVGHLENNQFAHVRRPVHQRSQSDMGGFARGGRMGYPPAQSSVYSPEPPSQYGRPTFHEQPHIFNHQYSLSPRQQPRWEPITPQSMPHGYQQRQMGQPHPGMAGNGHHRVQSTPMAPSAYGPSGQQHFGNSANYGPPLPSVPHITENQQVRDMYSSRR